MSLSIKTIKKAEKIVQAGNVSRLDQETYKVISITGSDYKVSKNFETGFLECNCKGNHFRPFKHSNATEKNPNQCSHTKAVELSKL